MNWKCSILVLASLLLGGSRGMAFDTCIYIDRSGGVLRLNPMLTSAELSGSDGSTVTCTIKPASGVEALGTGTCLDAPGEQFVVFTGASNPFSTEDDILIFRNAVWYQRCAFTR